MTLYWKLIQQVITNTQKGYANMIKLNEDKEIVDFIRKKLKENKDKYGEQFCPCVIPTKYESENKEDYICMCKEFREQTEGECHCGLYVKTK